MFERSRNTSPSHEDIMGLQMLFSVKKHKEESRQSHLHQNGIGTPNCSEFGIINVRNCISLTRFYHLDIR